MKEAYDRKKVEDKVIDVTDGESEWFKILHIQIIYECKV